MSTPSSPNSGFTLLEVLVVMVITALVSTVLLQALDQVYRLQTKFGQELAHSQRGSMYIDWYRQTLQGLQPDQIEGPHQFKGSQRRIEGITASPISAAYGVPTYFFLEISYANDTGDTQLVYATEDSKFNLMRWSGRQGEFSFIDANGQIHKSWPPEIGQWPQLPSNILLRTINDGAPLVISAVPRGPMDSGARVAIEKLVKPQ